MDADPLFHWTGNNPLDEESVVRRYIGKNSLRKNSEEPNPEWEEDNASAEKPGEDAEKTGGPTSSAAVQRLQKKTTDKKATGPTPLIVPDIHAGSLEGRATKRSESENLS